MPNNPLYLKLVDVSSLALPDAEPSALRDIERFAAGMEDIQFALWSFPMKLAVTLHGLSRVGKGVHYGQLFQDAFAGFAASFYGFD